MVIRSQHLAGLSGHDGGRQLLGEMYRDVVGAPMPPIETDHRGKPGFSAGAWHFSISHTDRHVFCALADRPVGIDAEEMDRRINPNLAEKILSPREKQRYLAAGDPSGALLRLWVMKEAYAKATGRGLGDYLWETDFSPDDPRIQEIDGCYVAVVEE